MNEQEHKETADLVLSQTPEQAIESIVGYVETFLIGEDTGVNQRLQLESKHVDAIAKMVRYWWAVAQTQQRIKSNREARAQLKESMERGWEAGLEDAARFRANFPTRPRLESVYPESLTPPSVEDEIARSMDKSKWESTPEQFDALDRLLMMPAKPPSDPA